MIRGVVFFSFTYISHFQEQGIHTYLFSIDIPEIQLITSVFRLLLDRRSHGMADLTFRSQTSLS